MKLRDVRNRKTPPLMIIPMIDIMFFLLVFFMLSTMYMIDMKTIPVKLPQAKNAATDTTTTFAVTMRPTVAFIWAMPKRMLMPWRCRQDWSRRRTKTSLLSSVRKRRWSTAR